jgi:hypothetical protein
VVIDNWIVFKEFHMSIFIFAIWVYISLKKKISEESNVSSATFNVMLPKSYILFFLENKVYGVPLFKYCVHNLHHSSEERDVGVYITYHP